MSIVKVDLAGGEQDVASLGGERRQSHAQRVGSVLVDHVQRVDDVALGLAHLLSVFVADQGVDVDVLEGHLVHELEPHHDHPGHPEEDDVEPRDHQRGRVEVFELRGIVRPAHRGEGPERAAEPGVQDVLILDDVCSFALFAGRRNILNRAKNLIPVLVPLFISAFRIAQDMAMAMEARCYRGGEGRTRMNQMKMGRIDIITGVLFILYMTIIIMMRVIL